MSRFGWCLVLFALAMGPARAEYNQLAVVSDGTGQSSVNEPVIEGQAWRHQSAGGQGGGIQRGTAGGWTHAAGFLAATEVLQPGLDTNGNGTPDELDPDNDGDTLTDWSEVDSSAFDGFAETNPNRADTDGDGMTDTQESAGLYDPLDPGHLLVIESIEEDAGALRINWVGKGGGTINTILACPDLAREPVTNLVHSGAFWGGTAPWYKTTNTYAWFDEQTSHYFAVRTAR